MRLILIAIAVLSALANVADAQQPQAQAGGIFHLPLPPQSPVVSSPAPRRFTATIAGFEVSSKSGTTIAMPDEQIDVEFETFEEYAELVKQSAAKSAARNANFVSALNTARAMDRRRPQQVPAVVPIQPIVVQCCTPPAAPTRRCGTYCSRTNCRCAGHGTGAPCHCSQ